MFKRGKLYRQTGPDNWTGLASVSNNADYDFEGWWRFDLIDNTDHVIEEMILVNKENCFLCLDTETRIVYFDKDGLGTNYGYRGHRFFVDNKFIFLQEEYSSIMEEWK